MNADLAHAAALASLPRMTPRRLRVLLDHHHPTEAWAVVAGAAPSTSVAVRQVLDTPQLVELWRGALARCRPALVGQRCDDAGIGVLVRGQGRYPEVLTDDPAAPAVLFVRGDLGALAGRRAGVVGTRNATSTGRSLAAELGRDLTAHEVVVVSGLARGIDGAAHRGVLEAGGRPVAVVASGPDVVYPREHALLWQRVVDCGVLLTESPPGTAPEAHRFPLRNRVLAALSEVLVVVESRSRGGSLITAVEATERGIPVLAVPGSVRQRAADGTNDLLADGAIPMRDVGDVLVALGLEHRRTRTAPARVRPGGLDGQLLTLLDDGPRCLDDLVELSGASVADVAVGLGRLEATGWLVGAAGWFERCSVSRLLP